MKKTLLTIVILCFMLIGAAAADIFPNEKTGQDGTVLWGYMNESAEQVIPCRYRTAGFFEACGLAVVTDAENRTGVIDDTGEEVIPFADGVVSVAFAQDMVAVRLKSATDFYTTAGQKLVTAPVTTGFYSQGLLPYGRKDEKTGATLWGYLGMDGKPAIEPCFSEVGPFSQGRAIVKAVDGSFAVIDTKGTVQKVLPKNMQPVMEFSEGDIVTLFDGERYGLYSVTTESYLTDMVYQEIKPYYNGYTMARLANRWILLDRTGKRSTEEYYYYLTDMGDGAYAARGEDGSVSVIDSNGNLIYRTLTYYGGFEPFVNGLSWHGTEEGDLVFFRHNGGFVRKVTNAENPKIVSTNVVLVTRDGKQLYIRVSDGKVLYDTTRSYTLENGITMQTVKYEKYLGVTKEGKEYGWYLTYPQLSGMANTKVQSVLNTAVKEMFLAGPSFAARNQAIEGNYGFAVYGRVLVVWVNALCDGQTVWNDNVALDLKTGAAYTVKDLYTENYENTLRELLPTDMPLSFFSYPRITAHGITYYNNYVQSIYSDVPAQNELSWEKLAPILKTDGAFYLALQDSVTAGNVYSDVLETHWAYNIVLQVSQAGYMKGDGVQFRPDDSITEAEAAVTLTRVLGLKQKASAVLTGFTQSQWYADAVNAAYQNGLLKGLESSFLPEKALTRERMMAMLANRLIAGGAKEPSLMETNAALAKFADGNEVSAPYRTAAALVTREGLVQGSAGSLNPKDNLTRAEFAKLLLGLNK